MSEEVLEAVIKSGQLNPCKNCGSSDLRMSMEYDGSLPFRFKVICSKCRSGVGSESSITQSEANVLWNSKNKISKIESTCEITDYYKGGFMYTLGNEIINEYKVEGNREITNGERKVSEVIHQAMLRCFSGKGKERHNIEGTVDFMDQPLMEISRRTGIGGPLYQVHKKAYEAHDMVRKGDSERARNELLDIIIYTAATVLLLDEQKGDK